MILLLFKKDYGPPEIIEINTDYVDLLDYKKVNRIRVCLDKSEEKITFKLGNDELYELQTPYNAAEFFYSKDFNEFILI